MSLVAIQQRSPEIHGCRVVITALTVHRRGLPRKELNRSKECRVYALYNISEINTYTFYLVISAPLYSLRLLATKESRVAGIH